MLSIRYLYKCRQFHDEHALHVFIAARVVVFFLSLVLYGDRADEMKSIALNVHVGRLHRRRLHRRRRHLRLLNVVVCFWYTFTTTTVIQANRIRVSQTQLNSHGEEKASNSTANTSIL